MPVPKWRINAVTPARRTNTVLAASTALLIVAALIVAIVGDRDKDPNTSVVTSTTMLVDEYPDTGDDLSDDNDTNSVTYFSRPAATTSSWFTHTFQAEQFDFPMDQLSCTEMSRYLSLELCAVAKTSQGDFMVTATEAFWNPENPDSDGVVRIDLNFSVYAHTTNNGPARAMSVLDGYVTSRYDTARTSIEVLTATVNDEEIIILQWISSDTGTAALGKEWKSLQVLAMTPTGLPAVVATYDGIDAQFATDATSFVITSLRFGPPSRNTEAEPWLTVIRLTPNTNGTWQEIISSEPASANPLNGTQRAKAQGSYTFPRSSTTRNSTN